MYCIPLVPYESGVFAKVDNADFWWLAIHEWRLLVNKGGNRYAYRSECGNKLVFMHRAVLGSRDGTDTDHVNHDGLDNRRANLRECNPTENMRNRRKARTNRYGAPCSSRFKGVCWVKGMNQWVAQIGVDGRRVRIGYFSSDEAAALAYDNAARRHFGKFAALNFPKGNETAA